MNLRGIVPRKLTAACCPPVKNRLEGLHLRISAAEVTFRDNDSSCHVLAAPLSSEEPAWIHRQLAAGYNWLVIRCLHGRTTYVCCTCDVCDVMKKRGLRSTEYASKAKVGGQAYLALTSAVWWAGQ